jgi:hypothetical protein
MIAASTTITSVFVTFFGSLAIIRGPRRKCGVLFAEQLQWGGS